MKIDNTIFIVETEESEAAHETAEQKIKKLIEAGIDGLVNEERRRLNNQKATFEGWFFRRSIKWGISQQSTKI